MKKEILETLRDKVTKKFDVVVFSESKTHWDDFEYKLCQIGFLRQRLHWFHSLEQIQNNFQNINAQLLIVDTDNVDANLLALLGDYFTRLKNEHASCVAIFSGGAEQLVHFPCVGRTMVLEHPYSVEDFDKKIYNALYQTLLSLQKRGAIPKENEAQKITKIKAEYLYGRKIQPDNTELEAAYKAIKGGRFPSMPKVVQDISSKVRQSDVEMSELSQMINQDALLAGNILKIVNSPAFGLVNPIKSIDKAVVILGLDKLKSHVICAALEGIKISGVKKSPLIDEMRKISSISAFCATSISHHLFGLDPEMVYMAGLFLNSGEVLIASKHPNYEAIFKHTSRHPYTGLKGEFVAIGSVHPTISFLMAKYWHLPAVVCQAIYLHHIEDFSLIDDEELRTMVAVLQLSTYLTGQALARLKADVEWESHEENVVLYKRVLAELDFSDDDVDMLRQDLNFFVEDA
jgi:HD-like signal output (HDOD) protein